MKEPCFVFARDFSNFSESLTYVSVYRAGAIAQGYRKKDAVGFSDRFTAVKSKKPTP